MKLISFFICCFTIFSLINLKANDSLNTKVSIIILGTIQDAGSPQINCKKDCCKDLFIHPDKNRKIVSLGIVDYINQKKYLVEATPYITSQSKALQNFASTNTENFLDGIFLTHAHIGHYTGLMYLGKEAMNASSINVFAMPKMKQFLEQNVPWSQLIQNKNIAIQELKNETEVTLSPQLSVIPFTVPHRDEYSETVGYTIIGPNKKALFIPDIDKWEKWNKNIIQEIKKVDYAFIDGTFFDAEEINNRNIAEIPHPFIIESMIKFKDLSKTEKDKIYFIHFNHTNPVLNPISKQYKMIEENGFHIIKINDTFNL
jgi:pyrroloquinoline quinone biosynthesis protein B